MYLRVGLLGLSLTFAVNLGRDDWPAERGVGGGSTHNFERFIDDTTYEYEEEPEDAFGFR